jgi:hypothetical protein
VRQFHNARLRVGLSWPNLSAALGRDADARRWGVLYLGSVQPGGVAASAGRRAVIAVDRKGAPLPDQDMALAGLDGLILLDGSWSQAKALWWRNPWLLKSRRLVLDPRLRSAYGRYRREPRPDAVSTLEAAGLALADLERRPELAEAAVGVLRLLVQNYAAAGESGSPDSAMPSTAAAAPRRSGLKRPRQRRR